MIGSADRRIGSYILLAELGRGAMGVVYRALDERLEREVALKVLWPHFSGEPAVVERFAREAKSAARANHPNVVQVFAVGQEDGYAYLAMEYVCGPTLREKIETAGTIPEKIALPLFRQILRGLAATHEEGLIHRDLKPGNILIDNSTGNVKIADFGLARAVEEGVSLTATGEMLGTPEYLAPEIAKGAAASCRSDLYAAGIVFYRMLTGRAPFAGTTTAAILAAHQCGHYLRPSLITEGIPLAADAVLARLMACNPEDRYPDCRAALDDLDRWEKGEEILPGLPPGYEAIDAGLIRRPPGWARAAWNRVDSWMRFQCLEVFGRTEQTMSLMNVALRELERNLRDTHRRLEEVLLLRERLEREIRDARDVSKEADSRAERLWSEQDEAGARAALSEKISTDKRLTELVAERTKTEALAGEVKTAYERSSLAVGNARHRADLLLVRRRRARLELSILGRIPATRRRTGERVIAVLKIMTLALGIGVAFVLGAAFSLPPGSAGKGLPFSTSADWEGLPPGFTFSATDNMSIRRVEMKTVGNRVFVRAEDAAGNVSVDEIPNPYAANDSNALEQTGVNGDATAGFLR